MPYTEIEVSNLMQEVEKAFTAHLAKAESATPAGVDGSVLAKSEEAEEKPKAKDEKSEAPAKSDDAPAEDKGAPAAEASKDAPAADAPAAPEAGAEAPAAAAPAAAPGAEGHDYDDEDMAAMVQMYQEMSRPELKAHHDAIKQCLDAMGMNNAAPAAPAEGAAPAAPAAEAAAPAAPEALFAKSEDGVISVPAEVAQTSKEVEILKSEVSVKETKIQELQKSLDTVTDILTKLVKKSAPAAKAVTKLEAIAKSEIQQEQKQFSKSEITSILTNKTKEPSLAKSDRDAINAYYAAGQVSTTGISHLLK